MNRKPTDKMFNASWKIPTLAFLLAVFSIICALSIGFFTFKSSVSLTEQEYHEFYLKEAQMLVKAAEIQEGATDENVLSTIRRIWGAAKRKPADEYVCIVDKNSHLILHTASPGTVGNYAGNNQLLGDKEKPACTLSDLVQLQKDYVGEYIASSGQKQIAAFAASLNKNWMIGKSVVKVFPGVKDFKILDVFQRVWRTGIPEHHPTGVYKDERILGWRDNFVYKLPSGEIVAVYSDETERKKVEEEKAKLEEQLRQGQKMEAIGTLAGGIAHDFNNILFSIVGFTELALDDAQKGTLQYENLREVLTASNRAKDLVQQILTFSRQADQEKKPVQVKLIVKEALRLLRASIPSTIEIRQNIESSGLVMGDATQIHQVLMNLCTNAAHAMGDKAGALAIDLFDVVLDSDFISNYPDLQPGPYINITVADTGHGMMPNVIDKIFDPFFTTKEKGKGTGMGISVAHGIVHSHGGTIKVYSEPGKGTTFKVFLPAIERHLKPKEEIEKPFPTGTERILFIDDEPSIVNLSRQILESLGYDVVTRISSIEALELFKVQKDSFDLVITDLTMPQMTGEKLAKELMRIKPGVPVILCTGFSARIDEQRAMEQGIRAFISKPILKREIAEAVRKALDS